MTPEEIQKAKDKIAKLLNMTVQNGCTEDEQESAMRMAAGLATRMGISLDSVTPTGSTPKQRKAIRKAFSQEFKIHQVLAAQAAGCLYGCDVFTYNGGKQGLFFVGREENVTLSEQTMFWLMRQVELLYKQALPKGLTQAARAEYRRTFKAACAHRVYQRALSLMHEMKNNNQAAQQATGSNALVVQGYFDQLREENRRYWAPTPEQLERSKKFEEERAQREAARLSALTPAERAAEEKRKVAEQRRAERLASRRKGPRIRTLPTGSGTFAGRAAGDQVKLRGEIK